MWTCKKCGNTKIIKKEVEKIEKIGYVNSNCSIYNEKIIGSETLEELYHCSKCGAEDGNLEKIAYKTEDMYLGYWIKELDNIHKKYFKTINSTEKDIIKKKLLYKNKKDDIYNLLTKSQFVLNDVEFKEYRKIIDIALSNCCYKINKYKLQEDRLKTHWYIKRNLTISKCYPDDKDILHDMYSNGNYIFDNREECVNMLERIKNSRSRISFY